jgi:hypothetical protein
MYPSKSNCMPDLGLGTAEAEKLRWGEIFILCILHQQILHWLES